MKKISMAVCLLLTISSFAQDKFVPSLKQGSVLNYNIFFNSQTYAAKFSLDSISNDYIKVGWNIDQLGNGAWAMKSKSINNGVRGYWGQPTAGMTEELPDDQIVLLFSKAQWASIQKDKKLTFDQQTYTQKQPSEQQQLKLAGKTVDALFFESGNGSTRIWILNNASYPVLLKIEGNTVGADLTVNSVE